MKTNNESEREMVLALKWIDIWLIGTAFRWSSMHGELGTQPACVGHCSHTDGNNKIGHNYSVKIFSLGMVYRNKCFLFSF